MLRLVVVLIGVVLVLSCNEKPKASPTQTAEELEQPNHHNYNHTKYVNERLNITLDNSFEWEIQENFQHFPLVIFSPLTDSTDFFRENINVFAQPVTNTSSITEYMNQSIEGIKQYLTGFEMEEAPQSVYIKGHEFKRLLYSHAAEDVTIKILVYFTIRNNQAMVINCSSLADTYPVYKPIFEKMVNSIIFVR